MYRKNHIKKFMKFFFVKYYKKKNFLYKFIVEKIFFSTTDGRSCCVEKMYKKMYYI